ERLCLEPRAHRREVLLRELAHLVVHLGFTDGRQRLPLLALPPLALARIHGRAQRLGRTEERSSHEDRDTEDQRESEDRDGERDRRRASGWNSAGACSTRERPLVPAGAVVAAAAPAPAVAPLRRPSRYASRPPARISAANGVIHASRLNPPKVGAERT